MKKAIAIFLFIIAFSSINAEVLDAIIVNTGTRTNKLLSDAPVKTEVVTSKDIEDVHAKNVSEALQHIPGLLIKETHGKQGDGVWIQGLNSDRVLILIDGQSMTSPTDQTVDLSQLSVSDIERIEIIKGAASALYGSQAMGGIINIITKRPKTGFSAQTEAELGSYGYNKANNTPVSLLRFSSTYKDDKVLASFFMDYNHDSGVKLKDTYTYTLPEADKINLNGEIRFLGNTEFYIKPRIFLERTTKPYTSYIPGIGDREEEKIEDVQKYRLTLGSETKSANGDKLSTNVFAERYISDSKQDITKTSYVDQHREASIDLVQAEMQYDTDIMESQLVTFGLLARYQQLLQDSYQQSATTLTHTNEMGDGAKSHALEGYVQDDWFMLNELELIPGVRYQYDSDFGSYVSPKISMLYTPYQSGKKQLNIRTSFGNGYRAPSLKERFFIFDHSQLGYVVEGNPNLAPETSKSYQVSFEWIEENSFSTSVNFYYNDITNLIDTAINVLKSEVIPDYDVYDYQNIGKALTYGSEIEGSLYFLKYFTLNGGYTYLYAEDLETKKYLPNRAEHQFKALLRADMQKTQIQFLGTYESEQYSDYDNLYKSPEEWIVNASLTRHVTKLFDIYGGIDNLFNMYQDTSNENDLRTKHPRYVYLGARYKF